MVINYTINRYGKRARKIEWLPAAIGFILGILFLLLLDSLIPHLHLNDNKPEGIKAKLKKQQ